jgi:hypothetical protein
VSRAAIAATIVIVVASAAAVGLLDRRHEQEPATSQDASEISTLAPEAPRSGTAGGQRTGHEASAAEQAFQSDTAEDLVADLKRRMAESVLARAGSDLKERLVGSGLSSFSISWKARCKKRMSTSRTDSTCVRFGSEPCRAF